MKSSIIAAASSAIALFLSTPALADQAVPAPTVETKAEVSAPMRQGKPALWILGDHDTTIYLFGTIHLLPKDVDWFDGGLKAAFASSDELVTEMLDPDQATMGKLMQAKGLNPNGVTVRSLMTKDQQAHYEAAMTKLGLPVASFDVMKPWLAAVTIGMLPLMKQGYDPNAGVEKVFEEGAGTRKRIGLETAEQQFSFFDDLPDNIELAYLDETVQNLDESTQDMDKLLNAWVAGNPEQVGDLINEAMDETPEIRTALLTNRNANWAKWIDNRLDKPGIVFIAVGAGHLAGKDNVRDLLLKRGIPADRFNY